LIEKWDFYELLENLEKFEWLDHNKLAVILLENWLWQEISDKIEEFTSLNEEMKENILSKYPQPSETLSEEEIINLLSVLDDND
jgi:hypothetical protein